MTRFWLSLSFGVAAFSLVLAAAPAKALNLVSYVSEFTGNNGNSCDSPTAPCLGIAGALLKTEPGGEIKCLDNHGDFAITIDKPITIDCAASNRIYGFSGQVAVTVNLSEATHPNGVVRLRNLSINGFLGNGAISSGTDGIRVIGGGGEVQIENCTILGFAQQGIDFTPTSSVDLVVRNTVISNNVGGGILLKPTGAADAKMALDDVSVDGNPTGITIDGRSTTGSIKTTVRDSSTTGNTSFGLFAVDSGGGATDVTVEESTSANNGSFGIGANGANATVRVRNSAVTGNANGLVAAASSSLISHGGNLVAGNTTNGAFTTTIPPQ